MSDLALSDEVRASFEPILKALAPARQALADVKDVVAVRPGYHYPPTGDPVPAVVVAVTPDTTPVRPAELAAKLGVPVTLTNATVEEQLAAARPEEAPFAPGTAPSTFEGLLTAEEGEEFAPPRSGKYQPLEPSALPLVNEKMKVTVCVSPEAGWIELEAFLVGT